MQNGSVIWITGLPGSGKTTLARALVERLRAAGPAVVHVDGDVVREMMGNDLGYSGPDRLRNAWRIARLSAFLAGQGLTVVCSTVSLFREIHAWNRSRGTRYLEVLVRARPETLRRRDQKGLLSGAEAGDVPHVLGVDQGYELPESPDVVVETDDGGPGPEEAAERVAAMLA